MDGKQFIPKDMIFDNILAELPIGFFWKDENRRFLGVNDMFLSYYGLESENQVIGKTDEEMGWHINPEPFRVREEKILNDGISQININGECIVKGDIRKIRASKYPIRNDEGRIIGIVGYFLDITEEVAEREKLFNLSHRDELTGLFNRRAYSEIARQFEYQYETNKIDFALYMIDLNDFKDVNDTYGHEFGNLVLKAACDSLKNAATGNSVAFRYGGDEFVLLHQTKSKEEAEEFKEKFISAIKIPKSINGTIINLSSSIGYELFSNVVTLSQLIENADQNMYKMKQEHKKKRA